MAWTKVSLGDVARLDRTTVNPDQLGSSLVDLYSIPGMDQDEKPSTVRANRIGSNKFEVPPDAILVSRINPRIPRVWLPKVSHTRRSLASTEFLVLRPQPGVDREFLFYVLSGSKFRQSLEARVTGTSGSHQRVRYDTALEIDVAVPNLDEQRRIAESLRPIESLRALELSVSRECLGLINIIFRAEFVESLHFARLFDFKSPNSLEPESVSPPNRVSLADVATFTRGVSYRSADLRPSRTALVTLACVDRWWGFRSDGLKAYVGAYDQDQLVVPGEVAVAHTDLTQDALVLGKPVIVQKCPQYPTLVASLDMAIVRPRTDDVSREFLFALLSTKEFSAHAYGYANGTTVLHLSSRALEEFEFNLPRSERIRSFTEIVGPMYRWLVDCDSHLMLTRQLRNRLIERYFGRDDLPAS